MKLKNIINLSVVLFASLTSCNVLDTKPFEIYDEATVWGGKSTADAFVSGTIANVMGAYTNGQVTWWDECTNNVTHVNGANAIVREMINRYDGSGGLGDFGNIRRCNLIIEKATEYAGKGLTNAESKELVAKGKLLRALLYYRQARTMGRFVWVDRVLAPADTVNNGMMFPTTKNTTESYTLLLKDLDEAIPDLPESAKPGELSKNSALAFKSEIALQAAAYEPNTELKTKWLQGVVEAVDAIKGHALTKDYGSIFNEKDRFSNEIILGYYHDKSNCNTDWISTEQNVIPNTSNGVLLNRGYGPLFKTNGGAPFVGWLWWSPTENLVEAYDVIDEETGEGVAWNETSQFKKNVTIHEGQVPDWTRPGEVKDVIYSGTVKNGKSFSDIIYNNRDARFDASIVHDGSIYWDEYIQTTVNGNLWRLTNGALGPHMGLTNYYWRKGVYFVSPRVFAGTPTDYHFVITRYGRALMNKAEAILWLAGMGKADYNDAVAVCNQTRTIHGQLPPRQINSLKEAWNFYKKERRVELCWENDFYWTLLRWGKHGGYANDEIAPGGKIMEIVTPPTYIEITNDRSAFYVGKVTHGSNDDRKFQEERRYLLPIPQGQLDRNPKLGPQNPGW